MLLLHVFVLNTFVMPHAISIIVPDEYESLGVRFLESLLAIENSTFHERRLKLHHAISVSDIFRQQTALLCKGLLSSEQNESRSVHDKWKSDVYVLEQLQDLVVQITYCLFQELSRYTVITVSSSLFRTIHIMFAHLKPDKVYKPALNGSEIVMRADELSALKADYAKLALCFHNLVANIQFYNTRKAASAIFHAHMMEDRISIYLTRPAAHSQRFLLRLLDTILKQLQLDINIKIFNFLNWNYFSDHIVYVLTRLEKLCSKGTNGTDSE